MKYSKIRKYIEQTISSYDPRLKAHDDAFNSDNIPANNIAKAYFVEYSVPSISEGTDGWFDTLPSATIKFYFKGFKRPADALDSGMDSVAEISQLLSSMSNIAAFRDSDNFPIQKCYPTSQIPEPLGNNDNSIIITLELELNIILTNC